MVVYNEVHLIYLGFSYIFIHKALMPIFKTSFSNTKYFFKIHNKYTPISNITLYQKTVKKSSFIYFSYSSIKPKKSTTQILNLK